MSLVKTRYETLAPRMEYLCDEVVLALAWKKASSYVRRHNWYADTLELDTSGLDLEGITKVWSYELANALYEPRAARLVPAPKNGRWGFSENLPGGWGPMQPHDGPAGASSALTLRPLAHLGIREQTVATAVLLCLADCVETAQGNPAVKATDALWKGVFSYGNRLYCRWSEDDSRAKFSWGSSDTYSRYYADYQQFVARPREVAAALESDLKRDDARVFLVKFDISAYYDRIKIPLLIKKLRNEYNHYRGGYVNTTVDEEPFWAATEAALTFGWSTTDDELKGLLKRGALPRGLPQGLMASGFFANAYLLAFDRAVGHACQKQRSVKVGKQRSQVKLHDYCRYVDDLRLVVSTNDPNLDVAELQTDLTNWVQGQLDKSLGDAQGESTLILNGTKTEIELLSQVAKATSIANRMRQVQQQLSGPFDLSSLEDLETALNGLLSMAEVGGISNRTRRSRGVPALALVTKPPMDVRDDTLTRFAAFRLCRSLKQRRLLTDLGEKRENGTAGEELQQDYELAARRLVGAWSENPSLVQVLRYAFDLYPSASLLRDVLDALTQKFQGEDEHPDQAAVAWYILAELFRAAATETGHTSVVDDGLKAGNIDTYRRDLAEYAESVLRAERCPWFVKQQAALLLATVNRPSRSLGDEPELARYRALHAYLAGRYETEGLTDDDAVGVAIVGYQLQGLKKNFMRWIRHFADRRGVKKTQRALELVYKGNSSLFKTITTPGAGAVRRALLNEEQALDVDSRGKAGESLPTGTWFRLSRATCHPTRPFRHENALLRLARSLTELSEWKRPDGSIYSVFDLEVRCEDWERLDDPDGPALQVRVQSRAIVRTGARFRAPAWCKPELSWQYAIGAILRAAAVGSNDFTLSGRVGVDDPGWYRGLSSTTSRRKVGMLHSSHALGGTASSVTPWFSGLLGILLRWPGIEGDLVEHPAANAAEVKDLRNVIEKRLRHQSKLFGRSSDSPVYRYPVRWHLRDSRTLRVVVVQGLLPSVADFQTQKLDGLSSDPFRTQHRNHTAALLNLVAKKLSAYERLGEGAKKPIVDLVVLPEYSIHVDDQDLLRAFSDDTGALLHYGLLGARHPNSGKHTNASRWLIPVRTDRRRSWIEVDQGKLHLTRDEHAMGVERWCPYRVVIELELDQHTSYRMVGAICYDATDLALAADMKNESHMFVVPAHNKDIKTFDNMIAALRYHMYQHVVICNIGEFGGSSAQAPYDEDHQRVISHAHGSNQISVAVFDVPMDHFGPQLLALAPGSPKMVEKRLGKTPPAGLARRR